jgi:predicted HNH restriction endonuclease
LKEKLWRLFSLNGKYKWVNLIDDVVREYNNTEHSTIKLKPSKVTKKNEKFILQNVYLKKTQNVFKKVPKFKIGEFVRISKYKKMFEKGYTPNYSFEIFKVINVNKKYPHTYLLEDYQNNKIAGQFYTEELQKVKHPNTYLVEKVLKQKGNKSYVKYLGFSSDHNEWINTSNII